MKLNYINILFVLLYSVLFIVFTTIFFKVFPSLSIFRPNFILITVVYLAIYRDFLEGIILVFLISYFENLHTPMFMGGIILTNVVIFLALNFLSQQLFIRNIRIIIILVSSVIISEKLVFLLILSYFRELRLDIWFELKGVLLSIPVNVITSLPIFSLLRKLDFRTGVKKKKTDYFSGPIYLHRI